MPKVFINYPKGAFSEHALAALAEEITTTGLECEKLPDTPYVRSNIWVYAKEYAGREGIPRRKIGRNEGYQLGGQRR